MYPTTILFVAFFFAGGFLSLARHPIFGLLTYVGVYYLSPVDRWWASGFIAETRWSLLAAGITLISVLIHRQKLQPVAFWARAPVVAMLLFVFWLALQLQWALEPGLQMYLLTLYAKFIVVVFLIVRCIDSPRSLGWFLWAHVLGCFYFGMIALTKHYGGRFEGFGGPGLDDANAGALALATGVLAAAGLFLAGKVRDKVGTVLTVPIVLNGLVATVSRSGFLAVAVGGVIFNLLTPKRFRRRVIALSALGLVLVVLVTNPMYWARMASIKYAGAEVEEVDTGGGRLEIMQAQFRMFKSNPLGCGHRCTATLSSSYLDDKYLTGTGLFRARSSHNTFMSLLVEQGMIGGLFYIAMVLWIVRSLMLLRHRYRDSESREASFLPAVAAVLAGITVGDMFVDFLKFENRIWFIGLTMVLLEFSMKSSTPVERNQSLKLGLR